MGVESVSGAPISNNSQPTTPMESLAPVSDLPMNTHSSFRMQLSILVHSLSRFTPCRTNHPTSFIKISYIALIWVLMFAARGASAQNVIGMEDVIPSSEYNALVSIYGDANGSAWTNKTGWLNPDLFWAGVGVDQYSTGTSPIDGSPVVTERGNVMSLGRVGINASGTLSGSIGNLTKLESLYFGSNQLSGSIPTSLGSCSSLQHLGLGDNQFTGSIPSSLGNLTSLITLGLHQNQLSGEIPASLGNLVNLRELWLPDNQLTGNIPATLSGMQQLQIFSVSLNQLSGSIPAFLGSLAQLVRLELNDNLFTGTIPAELGGLTQLQMLFIDGNQLTGQIPAALGNLASLEELFLSANQLTGAIPASLGGLTNLIGLGVEGNQLSGSIPGELGGLHNLEELALEHNQLAGRVPQAVLDLPLLTYLTVHNNYITLDTEQCAAFTAAGWSAGSYEPQKEPALAFTPVSGGMSGSPLNWEPLTDEPLSAQFSVENLEPGVSSLVVTVESQSPWLHVTATGSDIPAMTASVELSQQGGIADTAVFMLHLDLTSLEIGEIYTGSVKVFAGGRVTTVPVTLSYFDITPPEVTPPGSRAVEATGVYGAVVTYPAATATDNVEVTSITYSHPSGMIFPIGVTTVTVTAKDAADNEGTATFSITVAPANVTMSAANLLMTTTTLILTGSNFSPTPGNNTVAFTPTGTGTVTAASANSLTVTNLSGLTPGALYAAVTTNGLSSGAPVQVATVVAAAPGDLDSLNANVVGNFVLATVVQPDGKMIIAGFFTSVLGQPRNNIARLNTDGTLDTGFNPNANNTVYSVAMQADGQILLGGLFTSVGGTMRNNIARVAADGTLDTGFNPNANHVVYTVAVQADGQILLGGYFTSVGGTTRNYIARVATNGTLDAGFDPNANHIVYTVAVQADGRILLGGLFTSVGGTTRNYIARVTANGTLEAGFDPNASYQVTTVAVQADGQILLGGGFTSVGGITRNCIARLNADGSLDAAFDPNTNGGVYNMTVQADGKILLGGVFTSVGGSGRNRIARVAANGTLDAGFNPNANSIIFSVAAQTDGQILLGGFFTSVGDIPRSLFARLVNDPATQTLSAVDATQVLWTRGGSSPEVSQVTFELSTNGGSSYTMLGGTATRVGTTANWQLTSLSLPASGQLRVRGRTSSGHSNGSSGLVEAVASYSGLVAPAPTVTLTNPTALTTASATLHGTVNANSLPTTAHFEYGLTTSYGTTASVTLSPTDGSTVQNVSASITGLTSGTLYHYRLSATNSTGTSVTADSTFTILTAAQAANNTLAAVGLIGPDTALDATPHHDGVENLLKYAFNMSLSGPDSATMSAGGGSGLPGITAQPNGAASIFRFEFLRRKNSGLIYTPQKNGDLTNPNAWVPLADTPTIISIDSNWERVIYEEPYNATLIPRCFGRVAVSLP
ncbi:MAG TPA: hypothetical protein DDZ88_13210 [Verrucomicrobiales bacterium]|nr:hypothetical protein [Verrucomicrobiales bacterium]